MGTSAADRSFELEPYSYSEARALAGELDLSEPVAVALVRRGYHSVEAARTFLDAAERHDPFEFDSMEEIASRLLDACAARRRVTVHGDYDVDGVCSTAILVDVLRELGARCDWLIPDRSGDGYGLTSATVKTLAARGTELIVTADCGISSAAEVSEAISAGVEVIITDHHAPPEEGLPDCPILHPRLNGYPFTELCATAVAEKLAAALRGGVERNLDLVALATVADLVPLTGENRRLVREGLAAMRRSPRPGVAALLAASKTDPTTLDEGDLGFRLAPRINAAGRLYRADAGVELMLTDDHDRATAIASELDRANHERREVEREILAAAEQQLAAQGPEAAEMPAIVLAGEGWHSGVIGIVASRIVERHWRPVVVISLDGERGRGSGRSIPGFDLVGALAACSEHVERFGGHSAAAGLELTAEKLPAFRETFLAHAAGALGPDDFVRHDRIDALVGVGGEGISLELAEQIERLAPFGPGNPGPRLLMPSARISGVRPMGESGRHSRFNITSGSGRALGVAFDVNGELSGSEDAPIDVAVRLEVDRWNGSVQPRVVLRELYPLPEDNAAGEDDDGAGCPGCVAPSADPGFWERLERERGADPVLWPAELSDHLQQAGRAPREPVDRRGGSAIAALAEIVSSGDRVLAVCADASRRRELAERAADPRRFGAAPAAIACARCPDTQLDLVLGGGEDDSGPGSSTALVLIDWGVLARRPDAAAAFEHVALVDPPPFEHLGALAGRGREAPGGGRTFAPGYLHLMWGKAEVELASRVLASELSLRPAITAIYAAARDAGPSIGGEELIGALIGGSGHPRPAEVAGRCLRVLGELELIEWSDAGTAPELGVLSSNEKVLESSRAFRAYEERHRKGEQYLRSRQPR